MADTILVRSCMVLSPGLDQKERVELLASVMIDWAFLAPLVLFSGLLPYGRYSNKSKGRMLCVNAKLGWILQEFPAFFIPVVMFACSNHNQSWPALILLSMFTLHYGHRVLIYSFSIRGGKDSPLPFFLSAMFFCTVNGYMQTAFLLHQAVYPPNWLTSWNFILGSAIFLFGLYSNIRCDNILRNLRKPGETGYKIPRGWMFDYVSGGNYFGEIVEWGGWALACWSPPSFAFAAFAAAFLGSRSYSHHKWYLQHFPKYPKNRKILIPFVL